MKEKDNLNYEKLLSEKGYVVIEDILPPRIWFDEMYSLFDSIISSMTAQSEGELKESYENWLIDNEKYYCGVPLGYRKRTGENGKDFKIYLQWCYDFSESSHFKINDSEIYNMLKKLYSFFRVLEECCSSIFLKAIKDIGFKYPHFANYFTLDRKLPIIFKIIRYEQKSDNLGTPPHYDKSALSMILDSNDQKVNWKIGQGTNCLLSSMHSPFEYPKDPKAYNHAILFPGLCLKEVDVDILPSPHFVMPIRDKVYRHSIVSFLLVPNLEGTEHLDTKAKYVNDLFPKIR